MKMLRRHMIGLLALPALAVALSGGAHGADAERPQYGGELNIGTVYATLSALSWDPADWTWKANHDTGMVREQLFAADLEKSVRKGGPHAFVADAYLPPDAIRGELAELWYWEDPLTLVVELRKGVLFPEKPGIMKARELEAEDVVFSYELVDGSPKKIATYFDHIERVEARDRHTVVFHFSEFNAEWDYRFGYGYYSGISPRELASVDAKSWRNVMGSGPFSVSNYVQGNVQTYARNPDYWDTEPIGGERYRVPFVDKVHYRIIRDEATLLTALRTGKLDILETVRWIMVDHLKETTPELRWHRFLSFNGDYLVLRMDQKPFDDIRVRRAMNLAVNQREIVELFYGGHAELMAFPLHPAFGDYFQPLEEMPEEVRELFEYKPEKARRLLAEAGYPDGFTVDVQVSSSTTNHMDMIPLLTSYLADVGVKLRIQPYEYASHLSLMTSRNHGPAYFMSSGAVNPLTSLRSKYSTGQTWNASMYSDPAFDAKVRRMYLERDERKRIALVREMTIEVMAAAPHIWLPSPYAYTAWWPWVKNYNGEMRAGAVRPGPIYARIWIDQELKRQMGFAKR
ncbi:MAG: ABC transporter substrate-binding protein [Alphaproteobacteria bacterium]|nr:ABC transporter substrate-binding protein [Alphaproteobacteria bacterium]